MILARWLPLKYQHLGWGLNFNPSLSFQLNTNTPNTHYTNDCDLTLKRLTQHLPLSLILSLIPCPISLLQLQLHTVTITEKTISLKSGKRRNRPILSQEILTKLSQETFTDSLLTKPILTVYMRFRAEQKKARRDLK